MKFRKIPKAVEAVQFTEDTLWWHLLEQKPLPEGLELLNVEFTTSEKRIDEYVVMVKQDSRSKMPIYFGEWLVYESGEPIQVYNNEYFKQTYEQVED